MHGEPDKKAWYLNWFIIYAANSVSMAYWRTVLAQEYISFILLYIPVPLYLHSLCYLRLPHSNISITFFLSHSPFSILYLFPCSCSTSIIHFYSPLIAVPPRPSSIKFQFSLSQFPYLGPVPLSLSLLLRLSLFPTPVPYLYITVPTLYISVPLFLSPFPPLSVSLFPLFLSLLPAV